MRPDGSVEEWDDIPLIGFKVPGTDNPDRVIGAIPHQRRLAGADILQGLSYIGDSLVNNQSYFRQPYPNRYRVLFPYAWYMKIGDKIKNCNTDAEYTVRDVLSTGMPQPMGPGHEVVLSGANAPLPTHRLRLDQDNLLDYFHSWPKAMAEPYKFDSARPGVLQSTTEVWNDTITFLVTRKEPASMGPEPFGSPKAYKPQHAEFVQDREDPTTIVQNLWMTWESLVRFDCWAQTNSRAAYLLAWFEDFMLRHIPVFMLNGVQKILPWRVDQDQVVTRWRNDIVSRSVIYYFRTQTVYTARTRRITDIEVTADLDLKLAESVDQIPPAEYEGDVIEYPGISGPVIVTLNQSGPSDI